MDFSMVTNTAAKAFLGKFFSDREINRTVYEQISEEQFGYKMTPKSDTPRQTVGHQIGVEQDYLRAIETGKLEFKSGDNKELKKLSKQELLQKLKNEDQRLIDLLNNKENCNKKIHVPWSKEPILATSMLWGMDSHEILHTGWNLALMDHLGIERFPALKKTWG